MRFALTRWRRYAVGFVAIGIAAIATARALERVQESRRRWVRVARDANYDISIDTSRIEQNYSDFVVWYKTDHAQPRNHKGKSFNREIVRSVIDCRDLEFKVLAVDLSMNGGRPVSRQRTSEVEASRESWRTVERGTSEEIAALAACTFARRQYPR